MYHFIYFYAECHNTECRYTKCRYTESRYTKCRYTECHHAECRTPRILPLATGERKMPKKFTFYFKNGLAFWSFPRSDSYLIEVILGYWIIWTKLTLMN